jgi:hypothetical protein
MKGTIRRVSRALLAGGLLSVLIASVALAYAGEVAAQVVLSGSGGTGGSTVSCDKDAVITARVMDNTGKPIEGQPVHFELTVSQSADDRVDPEDTVTDANGDARTTVSFGAAEGAREIEVSMPDGDPATGSIVIRCAGGLPPTSTASIGSGTSTPPWSMALAAAAVLLGSVLMVRRVRG